MTTSLQISLPDAAATRSLGGAIGEVLGAGDVVLLLGELGAGKTTLTKGLVAACGSDEEVTSPTFTLLHLYKSHPPIAHVDCWRLERLEEASDLGLDEMLDDGSAAVIEWGEFVQPLLGRDALSVVLVLEDVTAAPGTPEASGRHATLSATGARWPQRMRHLLNACRNLGLRAEAVELSADEPAANR